MAGVPPDYFSATGQLWGNPVYDWAQLEREGFGWWIRRFHRLTALVDVVRIDHFRGFQAYWQVPQGEATAVNGEWVTCPGDAFFHTLEHELGHLPVWAEDLGIITPDVEKLRDAFDFPGMKVLQFGFDEKGAENPYLPFNFVRNCVCYTGTHDNDTTAGWWAQLEPERKRQVLDYLGDDGEPDPLGDDPPCPELGRRQRRHPDAGPAGARERGADERARSSRGELGVAPSGWRAVGRGEGAARPVDDDVREIPAVHDRARRQCDSRRVTAGRFLAPSQTDARRRGRPCGRALGRAPVRGPRLDARIPGILDGAAAKPEDDDVI